MNTAEIVINNLDPWIAQEPEFTKYQLVVLMSESADKGLSKFYRFGDSVFYVVRNTPWIAELHLFSDEKSYQLVRNMKQFLDEFWRDTSFMKLQGSFANKKICALVEKTGWKKEGLLEKCYMLPDGTLADKFIYGVSRCYQSQGQ